LDLIFVSDHLVINVSRIDPLVLHVGSYHPALEITHDLPVVEQTVLPKTASKPR